MNEDRFDNPHQWPIPSDDYLKHWLVQNYKALHDPENQDIQSQRLVKMTIVIVEELLHRRKIAASPNTAGKDVSH